jgi:hypothetical protein
MPHRFAPKNNGNYYEPQVCPLFPHEDVRQKFDDYGQMIDLQHFLHPPSQRDFPLTADSLVRLTRDHTAPHHTTCSRALWCRTPAAKEVTRWKPRAARDKRRRRRRLYRPSASVRVVPPPHTGIVIFIVTTCHISIYMRLMLNIFLTSSSLFSGGEEGGGQVHDQVHRF